MAQRVITYLAFSAACAMAAASLPVNAATLLNTPPQTESIPAPTNAAASPAITPETTVAAPAAPTPANAAPAPADEAATPVPDTVSDFAYPKPKTETAKEDGKPSDFETALAQVYLHHPQLIAQRKALEATDEGVAQAVSGFRPTANATYNKARARNNRQDNTWFYADNKSESLQVTQPIFRGGSTLASYASAKDRVKAGRAQLTALEQEVLLTAVVAYTDVVEKQYVLEVNQNNVDVLSRQLKASQARFDVGELTRTDVAQSQARLASAQAAERQALGNLAASQATFRRVIGYDPPSPIVLPVVPSTLPATEQEVIRIAELNNPVLEAAQHLEKASESEVDVRTGTLLPSVDLHGSMSRRNAAVPGLFRQSQNDTDQVALNVTIPLYQSGAEWSRIRQAKNLAQQAKFNTMDTKNSIVENASRAWQDFNTAKAIIVSNEEAVKAAQEALDGVRQENLYGTRTILDVLDTEQDFFNARVNLVIATVAEKQQAYRLLATIGRLTAKDMQLKVDLIDPETHYDKVKYQLIGF